MSGLKKNEKRQFLKQLAFTFALTLIAIIAHPLEKFDRSWSDIILSTSKSSISQKYLIVDITAEDMGQSDGVRLPRGTLAQTLTALSEAGAKRIVLDLTLSEKLSSREDLSLIAAMSDLGPERLSIPHGSAEKFKHHASLVDIGLLTDPDGWTRAVRTSSKNAGYNPAAWLANGQLSKEVVQVDLRHDYSTLERLSVADILARQKKDLSNYHVIISPDPLISPSRVQLPLSKRADRSVLIALGSEAVSTQYQNTLKRSRLINLSVAFALTVLGVFIALKLQAFRILMVSAFVMSITTVALNVMLVRMTGGQGYPVLHYTCFLIGMFVTTAYRLGFIQMFRSLLKGDLSPEEAWAWRAYEDSPLPVVLLNSVGNVRRMNAAGEQMKSSLGDDFAEKCQADFRQGASALTLMDQNEQQRHFSLEWPNKNVGIIVMRDATDTARKFNELEERAESFEQKKELAEAESQQKSKFLAHMSHELRTPLNAINGFSDILHREIFGPLGDVRYKEYASNILFSGQHLLALINDILDLSKIEAGKMVLNIEDVEVNDLVAQSLRIVNVRAKESGLNLVYENKTPLHIQADPRSVKQILLNLLTNAIKFTPEGGTVKVSVDMNATALILRVSDSGIGISQENIKRLAKPFQQVEDSGTKKIEGTGLGLSLSKSLVELHGGVFDIQSVVGEGTTVSFTLPVKQAEQNPVQSIAA